MRMERPCSCGQHRAMSDHNTTSRQREPITGQPRQPPLEAAEPSSFREVPINETWYKADLAADRRLHHRPEVKSLRRGREGQSKGRNNRDTIASSRIEDTLATS